MIPLSDDVFYFGCCVVCAGVCDVVRHALEGGSCVGRALDVDNFVGSIILCTFAVDVLRCV